MECNIKDKEKKGYTKMIRMMNRTKEQCIFWTSAINWNTRALELRYHAVQHSGTCACVLKPTSDLRREVSRLTRVPGLSVGVCK